MFAVRIEDVIRLVGIGVQIDDSLLDPGQVPQEYFFEPWENGNQKGRPFKQMLIRPLPQEILLKECQP